jgi:Fe-S cluster assembly ATPase SufC
MSWKSNRRSENNMLKIRGLRVAVEGNEILKGIDL